MNNIKVDKDSFYTMMENLFNEIYGENYVSKNKEEKGFTRKNEFFSGKNEECFLVTKHNKKILVNTQMALGIRYDEWIIDRKGTTFDTSILTLEEINEMIKEDVLEYSFLTKIPGVIESLKTQDNIEDDKIFISEELALAICISFKKYVNKEKRAERYLGTDISRMINNAEEYDGNNEELLPCQKVKGRRIF